MGGANNGRPALIFDVDGVILHWCSGFLEWMASQGHKVAAYTPSSYDMANCLPDLPAVDLLGCIENFNRSRAYARLRPLPGAGKAIHLLGYADFPAWRKVVVSATGNAFWTIQCRVEALERVANFDELHCIGIRDSKEEIFARYPKGSIVFEDSHPHAMAAVGLGHRVVFFDYLYNAECPEVPGLTKVAGWAEARQAAIAFAKAPA